MTVNEIIKILSNQLEFLRGQRTMAVAIGDLAQVTTLDGQIDETQTTLDQLNTLPA